MADLSSLYFDVTKDILYCDAANAPRRRAVQTVLYEMLQTILPVLVPVTPHLAEDIWLSLPDNQKTTVDGQTPISATLLPWPQVNSQYLNPELVQAFEALLNVRETVNQALEVPRSEGRIGKSLEAQVAIQPMEAATLGLLESLALDEREVLFNVSAVSLVDGPPEFDMNQWHTHSSGKEAHIYATPAVYAKCIRCWKSDATVGQMSGHPEICERCYQAVES
jgi:isoleucyl-tRNA synthetase